MRPSMPETVPSRPLRPPLCANNPRAVGRSRPESGHCPGATWTMASSVLFLGYRGHLAVSRNRSHGYFVREKPADLAAYGRCAQSENLSSITFEAVFAIATIPPFPHPILFHLSTFPPSHPPTFPSSPYIVAARCQ